MLPGTLFYPARFQWSDARIYFFVGLFAAGNLLLPQFCHLIPSGGAILLPIYFFTLVASYKFGLKVGVATAILSPVLNSFMFGMPPMTVLPAILIKSVLLALIANHVASRTKKLSLYHLAFVVIAYQILGCAIEWLITQSLSAATADLTIGIPGMVIQVIGGWWVLNKLALYDQH